MSSKASWRVGKLKLRSVSYCAVLIVSILSPYYSQARPCVDSVCLGDSIDAVKEFRYEPVESFGRPISPGKKRKLDSVYPSYPTDLAMPLLQGRFDNRILTMLPVVNKVCFPRSMIGKTLNSAGVQTQFTLQPDRYGRWRVVGISQVFPPKTRDELSSLNFQLDKKYGEYSIHTANNTAQYAYVFNPNMSKPYFVLSQTMPDKREIEKYRRNCT